MHASAEREMSVRLSFQVEMLGIVEFIRVAVRRANTEMDISSRRHLYAADRRWRVDPSVTELVGTLEPEKLFDC